MRKVNSETLMKMPLIIGSIISIAIIGIDVAIYMAHPEWHI